MSRTGEQENKQAQKDTAVQQKQSFDTGQKAIGQYQTNVNTLKSGGQVAADPWTNPKYLANVNRSQAASLEGADEGGKIAIEQNNRRTGGLNSTAAIGATRDLALKKMRLADQLTSERNQGDYMKNVLYQQQMAETPLNIASAENPMYGTATSGRGAALNNLTQFGLASYGPVNAAIGAVGQAAGAYAGRPPA